VEVRRGTNPLNPRDDQPAPGLKLIPGKTMCWTVWQFDRDGARLAPSSDSTLARLVRSLMENTQLTLEIAGYTDDGAPCSKNDVLSQRRADAVKAWLIAHGVGSSRLSSTGMGARDPVASKRLRKLEGPRKKKENPKKNRFPGKKGFFHFNEKNWGNPAVGKILEKKPGGEKKKFF